LTQLERRRKEMRMSRCFNWFPFWCIRRTQVIPEYVVFYKNEDFTWRVSDCEELVGIIHRGMILI